MECYDFGDPMGRGNEALITPELLTWARTTSHLTVEKLAEMIKVDPDRLRKWESGAERPTISYLRRIGQICKRPIAVFYLDEVPRDFAPLKDFRQLPGGVLVEMSRELIWAIRRANERRALALDLAAERSEDLPEFSVTATLASDPEAVAEIVRGLLRVSVEEQSTWTDRDGRLAFNGWRAAVEGLGVLVFQASRVAVDEMRGFSIPDMPLPAVVVNIQDRYFGRVFTMFHELGHIILKLGGVCELTETKRLPPEERSVEVWCNRFAGAVLVPREALLRVRSVSEHTDPKSWSDEQVGAIARFFRVSREVALRRLVLVGKATADLYRRKRPQYLAEYENIEPQQGRVPPAVQCLSQAGKPFVSLVLSSYLDGQLTLAAATECLGLKVKHFKRVAKEIYGDSVVGIP